MERLRDITEGDIQFDLIGPLEDKSYWDQCREIIRGLPPNIVVSAVGSFPDQRDALHQLSESHFFVLPTLNENFGYVFIEALAAGCPLLVSENTVWKDIEQRGVGWQIPLKRTDLWVDQINECVAMAQAQYEIMSAGARSYSVDWLADPEIENATAMCLTAR